MKSTFSFFITVLLLLPFKLFSQGHPTVLTPIFKAELGLHGAGLGYELPINERWVTDFNLHAGGGFNLNPSNEISFHYQEIPSIHLSTGIRRYYNLQKIRRNHANNAGNFFGAQIKYASSGLGSGSGDFDLPSHPPVNDVLISEIHWGIQRSLTQRLFFTAKIGVGYMVDFHNLSGTILPAGGVKVGYRLR